MDKDFAVVFARGSWCLPLQRRNSAKLPLFTDISKESLVMNTGPGHILGKIFEGEERPSYIQLNMVNLNSL